MEKKGYHFSSNLKDLGTTLVLIQTQYNLYTSVVF